MRQAYLVLLLSTVASVSLSEPIARLRSPEGAVEVSVSLDASGAPTYSVSFRGRPIVVDSHLGLTLRGAGALRKGFRLLDTRRTSRDESYNLVSGKTRSGRDRC